MPSARERGATTRKAAPSRPPSGEKATARDLIAVDVGNSETVVGLFRGETLATHWRLTSGRATADEVSLTLDALLRNAGGDAAAPGFKPGAVLCSVAPSLTPAAPRITSACSHPEGSNGPSLRHRQRCSTTTVGR